MIPMKFASMSSSGGSSFDPANPGAIGAGTPSTGAFTRLSVAQGTLTDPVTGLSLTATWNDAADTFRGLEFVVTDTASAPTTNGAGGSTLLRFLGGSSGTTDIFSVNKWGMLKSGFENVGNVWMLQMVNSSGGKYGFSAIDANTVGFVVNGEVTQRGALFRFSSSPYSFEVPRGLRLSSGLGSTEVILRNPDANGILQLGFNHATTAIAQRIQAHGVTTGTGASLTLGGGSGTVAKGDVILDGGNRSVYSPADFVVAPDLVRTLVSHGLMQLAGPLGFATSFGTPSESTLDVIWDDEETGIASQYRVEISSDDISFTLLEVVDQGVNLISASGLTPDTTYYFRIRSESAVGNSEWVFTNGATSAEE